MFHSESQPPRPARYRGQRRLTTALDLRRWVTRAGIRRVGLLAIAAGSVIAMVGLMLDDINRW